MFDYGFQGQSRVAAEFFDGYHLAGVFMEALFDFFNKVSPISFAFACEYLDVFGVDAQPTKLTGSWTRIWIRCRGGIGHRGGRREWGSRIINHNFRISGFQFFFKSI